jgi:beta-lactamase regulating signal transducer with metallopeptidase domain
MISWTTLALALYLTVSLVLLVRLAIGLALSRRLVRAAQQILDERVVLRVQSGARGLRSMPPACESELISVPLTIGVIRPVILLPASWREWEDEKLAAIIVHEMSHVIRRDALTQCVALLHRAIFWFSPLSWWLSRHLGNLAELASDEAALSSGADRNDYAKTLLGFFTTLPAAPQRVRWQGVAMAHAGQAQQRVERILAWRGAFTMGLKKSAVVLIVALAIPIVYVAASARPSNPAPDLAGLQQPAPTTTPEPSGAPTATPEPQRAPTSGVIAPAMPPAPKDGAYTSGPTPRSPVAPVGPVAPLAPVSSWAGQGSGTGSGRGFSYGYGFDDEQRFVIITGKSNSFTMSGSGEDARHVEKLRKQIPGDFIWFQRDEKSYIIRDQATIDRARKLWAPQEELGRKQEALGKQQEALGKQQEDIGAKMEQVRVNVPDMTAALDRLKAKLQKLGPSATMEQIGELQSEIGELQSKIGEVQSQAGAAQSKFGAQQGELGAKQGELGRQQGELGRQQGELARKATIQMKQILDEAIKNGTAKPEPPEPDSATL